MGKMLDPNKLSKADLIKIVLELRSENERLRNELEALKRKTARVAAPYSRHNPQKNPKPSGRKAGIGEYKYRTNPAAEDISQTISVVAPIHCPECGSELEFRKNELAFVTDLPEMKPTITKYEVEVKYCPVCEKQIRGSHPDLKPDQYGATAHRLGIRAIAAGLSLQFDYGITARKVPSILKTLTGISLTQSALTQQAIKQAECSGVVGKKYVKLRSEITSSAVINTDDTSWWLGGQSAYLMAFKTNSSVVYQIRRQHRAIEVAELIPKSYQGTLVTDRFVTYDANTFKDVKQQKCLAHLLKNLKTQLEKPARGRSHQFLLELRAVLKRALGLHHQQQKGLLEEKAFERQRRYLQGKLTKLLEDRKPTNKDNLRLQSELRKHHARGSLLRFLENPAVSPTNNAAERALRGAVIARKLSAGSKTVSGALALSAFKSVIETGKLAGVDGFNTLLDLYANRR